MAQAGPLMVPQPLGCGDWSRDAYRPSQDRPWASLRSALLESGRTDAQRHQSYKEGAPSLQRIEYWQYKRGDGAHRLWIRCLG